MSMVRCHKCNGTGKVAAPPDPKPASESDMKLRPCDACKGAGQRPSEGALRGAGEYHDWLESLLPLGVEFPLGVHPWLRFLIVGNPSLCALFGDDLEGVTEHEWRKQWQRKGDKTGKELEAERRDNQAWAYLWAGIPRREPEPAPRHKVMPLCLARCIHAAYLRVTPESIADWCLDRELGASYRDDVLAFIREAASTDTLLRDAGNVIASRRSEFSVQIVPEGGRKRGRPRPETRNAFIVAALAALANRYREGELARALRYKAEDDVGRDRERDWCSVVAAAFVTDGRPMTPRAVRDVWNALSPSERKAITKHL